MITKLNLITLTLILTWQPVALHASDPSPDPILRIETGMHTAPIRRISVDAAERFLLTASDDETLRLWDLSTGELLNIYRVPIGVGNEGKLYSGAISPDGEWVVGAGWTGKEWDNKFSIYLFQRASGKLVRRLSGLEDVIANLCFSPDNQYLGATLSGRDGVRIWNTQTWQLIFNDTNYTDQGSWCDFNRQNRMVTTSDDGYLRLYSFQNGEFTLATKNQAPGGQQPFAAVFSPEGDKIIVGFNNSTNVNVLDGNTLALLYAPDTTGIDNGDLGNVAWSSDGNILYAGGYYTGISGKSVVLQWPQAGQWSSYTTLWPASQSTIRDIRALKNGRIVYGAEDSGIAVLDNLGNKIVERKGSIADYRETDKNFGISPEGNAMFFGFKYGDEQRLVRFSLSESSLKITASPDADMTPPDIKSLKIEDLNIDSSLEKGEPSSRYLAIAPDHSKFLLGTDWYLRLFDANGQQIWKVVTPVDFTWGVNISGDGKKAVAAFGDGTIRWYNLATGQELLTFFLHPANNDWIVWTTPSGYYMASSASAANLIGWHVNRGKDQAANFYPAGALFTTFNRPDIVKKMLVTLDEAEAIRQANVETGKNIPQPHGVLVAMPVLNQAVYHPGDNLQVDFTLYGKDEVDFYVGLVSPQGTFQTIAYPLEFSMLNVLKPYQTKVTLQGETTLSIFDLPLPQIPAGQYQVCGLLTIPNSDPYQPDNRWYLNCKGFKFE